jgi:glycosyltransferase involved in cell wall biosynthesis
VTSVQSHPAKSSVLFVLPSLEAGGAERVVITMLRHLDRERFAPTLAVLDNRNPVFAADVPADVEVIRLGTNRLRYSLFAILRLAWTRRFDLIFTTIGHLNLGSSLLRPVFPPGVKLVVREASIVSEVLATSRGSTPLRLAYRALYRLCDKVVCQSEFMKRDLVESIGVRGREIVVIQNPIDLTRVRALMREELPPDLAAPPDEGTINFAAVGRLDHAKGFDLLIRAIALCDDPRLRVTILGEGPLRAELEALAGDVGVGSQVRLAGFRRNPYALLSRSDALVLSSRHEGMPNVVLEALACGTSVIATPAPGGLFEIVNGRANCIVARELTAEALSEAIQAFTSGARSDVAEADLREFSAESVTRRYERLFSEVLGRRE